MKTATSVKGKTMKATLMKETGKDKLLDPCITYGFGVLFDDGKRIACLQNRYKFTTLKILLLKMTSYHGKAYSCTVVIAFAIYFLDLQLITMSLDNP